MTDSPKWFDWAREIYSLAQAGITYSGNPYDIQRYKRLQEITAEMLASQADLSQAAILQSFSMQSGYATPKVDVRGAVIRDGKILLVREQADGRWAMPGGWGDIGDGPADMVAREVWEESGFKVRVDKLVGLYDANRLQPMEFYHVYKLVFLCSILAGEPTPSLETLEVGFFSMDELPPLSEVRTNRRILEEVFAHYVQDGRAAFFE
ncbi:MAG TPA: NUDIX hydrolase [Anaerolineales bacterium]|jgi:ADP-ribose pyrophosphatase YjhB (NUDIX family)